MMKKGVSDQAIIPGSLLPLYADVFSFPHTAKISLPKPQHNLTNKNSETDLLWPVSLFAPQGSHLFSDENGVSDQAIIPGSLLPLYADVFSFPHTAKISLPKPQHNLTNKNSETDLLWPVSLFAPQGSHFSTLKKV